MEPAAEKDWVYLECNTCKGSFVVTETEPRRCFCGSDDVRDRDAE